MMVLTLIIFNDSFQGLRPPDKVSNNKMKTQDYTPLETI